MNDRTPNDWFIVLTGPKSAVLKRLEGLRQHAPEGAIGKAQFSAALPIVIEQVQHLHGAPIRIDARGGERGFRIEVGLIRGWTE
jgi:hypothetical protein